MIIKFISSDLASRVALVVLVMEEGERREGKQISATGGSPVWECEKVWECKKVQILLPNSI